MSGERSLLEVHRTIHRLVDPSWRGLFWAVLIASTYFVAAKLGLSVASLHDNITAVWPPTGIAIAALLLLGGRVWPGVMLGAFLANITTEVTPLVAGTIAVGNTLEAVVAAWFVRSFAGGVEVFNRPWTIGRYVLLIAPLATAISASVGVTAIVLSHDIGWSSAPHLWMTWWLGDLVGAVLIAPLLTIWFGSPVPRLRLSQTAHALALVTVASALGVIMFGGVHPVFDRETLGFLAIPPMIWAAFAFGRHGAISIATLISVFAVWGTWNAHGPFFRTDLNDAMLVIQAFIATVTMMSLVVAALVAEHQRVEKSLRASQRREGDRAAELAAIIDAVPAVVWIAHDPECRRITGNKAAQEFLRLPHDANASKTADPAQRPTNFRVMTGGNEVADEDLPMQVAARTGTALSGVSFEVVHDDGTVLHELGSAVPLFDDFGRVRGAVGAFMDVTELKQAQHALGIHLRRLQVLYRLSNAVMHARKVEEIYEESLAGLMSGLNADRASVLLFDADGVMRFKAWRNLSDDYRRQVEGHSPWKPDEVNAAPLTIEDVAACESLGSLRDVVVGEGIGALAFVPLISNGRLLGKFMVYFNNPHAFSEHELQLAQAIAGHVAFALERRTAERNLHESKHLATRRLQELAAIYRDTPVGLCFVDANLRFVKINDRLAAIIGEPVEQLIGQPVRRILPGDKESVDILRNVLATGEAVAEQERVAPSAKNPEIARDWLVSYCPVNNVEGAVLGVNCVVMDITEQKKSQRELAFHRERLEEIVAQRTLELEQSHQRLRLSERMASMGTLAAGLGHDMGNLLLPIKSRLDVLQTLHVDGPGREHLEAIEHCVKYLHDLVRGLRLFAQDPEDHLQAVTSLEDWQSQTMPFFRSVLSRNIRLEFDIPEDLPAIAIAPQALTQAVLNLINNARDAIGGRRSARVIVRARAVDHSPLFNDKHDRTVRLSVIDNGPGMSPEVRARAIEPFFTTKTRSLSTGLGLSMVHGVVGAAGGCLEIHSPPSHESVAVPAGVADDSKCGGTEFALIIPVAKRVTGLYEMRPTIRPRAAVSVSDLRTRAVLASMLESMGYDVFRDANGHPGDSTVWFTEPLPTQLNAAREFLRNADNRAVVVVGDPTPEWHDLSVKTIDVSCRPSAIRAALER